MGLYKGFWEIFARTHRRIINLHLDRIALFVYTLCKFLTGGDVSCLVHIWRERWQCCALLFRGSRFSRPGFPTEKGYRRLLGTSQNIGWIDAHHPLLVNTVIGLERVLSVEKIACLCSWLKDKCLFCCHLQQKWFVVSDGQRAWGTFRALFGSVFRRNLSLQGTGASCVTGEGPRKSSVSVHLLICLSVYLISRCFCIEWFQ